jgi:hypothetical protein
MEETVLEQFGQLDQLLASLSCSHALIPGAGVSRQPGIQSTMPLMLRWPS